MIVYDLPVPAVALNLTIREKNQLSINLNLLKNVALHLPTRIMELITVVFKSIQYCRAECWDVATGNFSFTCWDRRDKVSFRMRSPSSSTLMKAFTRPPLSIIVPLIVFVCVCFPLQQWPMYMVDYSGVNVQVPGKVNYWRTAADCSKGIYNSRQNGGRRVNVIFMTLGYATLTLCPGVWSCSLFYSQWQWSLPRVLRFKTISPDISLQKADVWASGVSSECWGTSECMWIKNIRGQTNKQTEKKHTKAWLVFWILPPVPAEQPLVRPLKLIITFVFFFFPTNSCHPYLDPSIHLSHWVQQLVVLLTERKCLW